MTLLILLRHGTTDHNREGRLQGTLDVPMGEAGRAQADAAAAAIVRDYGVPDRIVCSPLARARETAAALGALVPVPVVAHPGLVQRSYGEWEGLTWDQIREGWPQEYARRMRGEEPRIAGWDGADGVAQRAASALLEACGMGDDAWGASGIEGRLGGFDGVGGVDGVGVGGFVGRGAGAGTGTGAGFGAGAGGPVTGARLVVAVSHGSAIKLGVLALMGLDVLSPALGTLGHGRWNVLRHRAVGGAVGSVGPGAVAGAGSGSGAWTLERYSVGPEG